METVRKIHQLLQKLTGLHRQLLELVRAERVALVEAEQRSIHDVTLRKEALIEQIRLTERDRLRLTGELAIEWRRPFKDLTITQIILQAQGPDVKLSEALRVSQQALIVLVERIIEQNKANQVLVDQSLEHVQTMKTNVLGSKSPHTSTYNTKGQRTNLSSSAASNLLSKEI